MIERDGRSEWAVIPYDEYERLVEAAEMLHDVRAYDEAKEALAAGEELVPSEVTYAILDGAHPVRVWREHRGLTQRRLAEETGISAAYLSQIESGRRQGSAEVLAALAKQLGLSLDGIVSA
ncbi:MAG: helix-turn-helix transcriptional regulator [Chloroflexota bacterium]